MSIAGPTPPDAPRPGPGGVGDGLPSLPSGEPVLHRWFVIVMLLLVPAGIGVTIWALTSFDRPELDAAARRPPGTAEFTHDRGEAVLNEDTTTMAGPGCAQDIDLVGDPSARAALQRAMSSVCLLLERPAFDLARDGLNVWAENQGRLRVGVFELTGVDSNVRLEDEVLVIELNAKFQFEDATRAAPAIVHELVHLALGAPPAQVDVAGELVAAELQQAACELLNFDDEPPRGCADVTQLLEADDPRERLVDAGYPG